ncbi:substrate-binding periplasmic protein [Bdellovibrio sp. HCB337]|uniref:substrate-binding periplasmic protein n=1 Tax=Bdellovibrio sp. HCB337 TaxID=3394358 RepID=UPI0039A57F58
MHSLTRYFVACTFFCSFLLSSLCHAETWKIITLDWPPYTNEKDAELGAASKALKEALHSVGINVEFVFMPWSRGIYEVKKADYVGIFPVWNGGAHKEGKLSPILFSSPIGFVYNKDEIHHWTKLEDFKGLNIGIVQSYEYPDEILDLGKKGVYHLQSVTSDEQNLHKVAYKRIDLTIVDLVNARYLTEVRHPELKPLLTFDPKIYQKADLFISLKNDKHFEERFKKLKEAFKKVKTQKIVDQYVLKILK